MVLLKDYFNRDARIIGDKKLFLLDMDGTIYKGDMLFDGSLEFLQSITDIGAQYMFITNNSSKSVKDYVDKLAAMGIQACEQDFYTSTMATADVLLKKHEGELIYVQGTRSFVKELKKMGLKVTTKYDETAKVILLGFDTQLTFEKLNTTSKMLCTTSAKFYATHPDFVCPTEYGYVPDLGSMCFGLFKASGKKPKFIGKPSPTMIYSAISSRGFKLSDAVVIGDRLMTDIAAGTRAGVTTVCVLSGEATVKDIVRYGSKPDFVFDSVKDMILKKV